MSVAYRQKYNPNVGVRGQRGWCLKYIDDAGNAPTRRPSAQAAANAEKTAGRLNAGGIPTGVWAVVFYAISTGPYLGLGHVVFMRRNANGSVEIRDSETASGARAPYRSEAELAAWFGGSNKLQRLGWSTHCDGRQYVEAYTVAAPKKSNDAIVAEVIAGKWGNGPSRVSQLKAAGYNPTTIQNIVNQKLSGKKPVPAKKTTAQIAREVIAGKWGNGPSRVSQLKAAGYNPTTIQNEVNKLMR